MTHVVLIVAREMDYRESLRLELEAQGYEVMSAADRAECTRALGTGRPQVIVADVQATATLSSVPEHVKLPIVTIANRPTDQAMKALTARSARVLTKPVDVRELCLAIEDALTLDVGRAPGAHDVLERLQRAELDPAWAAEMFLEEAHAAFLLEGGFDRSAAPAPSRQAPPVFPRPDVEVGFVWPAHTGRLVVEELLTARGGDEELSLNAAGACELVVGTQRLRTSKTCRFEDREEARQALVRAARERTQLDSITAAGTVLILQVARDGAFWLWTIMTDAQPLPEVLATAEDRRPWLEAYAVTVVEVLRTGIRHGFAVDLSPESFGVVDGVVRYFGEVGMDATTPNVVSVLDAVARAGWESDVFLEAFEREMGRRLTPEEAAADHLGAMSTSSVPPAYA